MKVDNNTYVTVLGIKFTIKEKYGKLHIAFNIDAKRKNRSTGLEATKKNLIVVKNEILPQFAQELIALKSSTQSTIIVENDNSTLESIADIHFLLHKEKVRDHVYKREIRNYNRHIIPYFKGRQLNSIKSMEIEAWQNRLLTKYKVLSVKKYRSIFYSIYTRAIQNELVIKNPFDNVPAPSLKKEFYTYAEAETVNPFTQSEIDKLLGSEDDTYIPNFIKLMSNCGARPGELIALVWDDIDFEKRTINIAKTIVNNVVNLPKTISSVRCIDMIDGAYEALQAQYKLTGTYGTNVFLNSSKKSFYSHDIINLLMQKRLKKLGIEPRSLYQFRHSFASRMIKNGIDITWVSKMLGHKDSSITLQVYTHYLKEEALEIIVDLIKCEMQSKTDIK
ncbi:tyrosine-type recombinase/integrase [Candidatus Sulfurimonas baltica]|uniref:Site-specific integrase n=1 Tax=Candidatus Sulfurimonas baltica TaxID=2740404 RepID=A0A7S7LT88_9BACT|nr:site-specific integrase [Candidatus Sulfurimonas baltica]QOY50935.1 site-specific integrase [Candidatus Sulfurimonas baltica]